MSSAASIERLRILSSRHLVGIDLRTMLLRMQSGDRSRTVEVDARQAPAFANPVRVRVLMACARSECSLVELQRQLELPLAKLHYHVGRLTAVELLVVSRTQRRAGRAIKFYRSVGDSFVVPPDLGALPGDALAAQLREVLRDEQSRTGELALRYTPAPDGKVLAMLMPQERTTTSRALELWRVINLNPRQRASLAKDLSEVLERYAHAQPEPGAEAMLVHAAFSPKPSRT